MKNKLLLAFCLAFAFAQMTWAGSKYFFVMIPPEFEEWMSSVPMLSMDGGQTGKPMTAVADMCGWYSYEFVNENISDNVVLYRDDDTERLDMIGLNGNWETGDATPIPLAMLFDMGIDSLFFVPDEEQKTNENGWYYSAAEVNGIEGTCEYTMAAIIYDTDASLHGAFTCYPTWHNGMTEAEGKMNDCYYATAPYNVVSSATGEVPCIGVTKGMVNEILGSSKKPELTTKGKRCFGSQAERAFAAMFNYTQGVNEKTCFDMPFRRNENNLWSFNSDTYVGNGLTVQGGFYPVENKNDAIVMAADPYQTPLSDARTKRRAEGPIFYSSDLRAINATERVPEFNLLCNGPAWENGIDCEGLFFDADETAAAIRNHFNMEKSACVFGWSCSVDAPSGWKFYVDGTETLSTTSSSPQWVSKTGRNQHFCYESHAKFTYKPGLRFGIRGDDDIWVYIDNQLAVDLGGTHMAAPGYVDLDNFKGASGKLEVGNQYDIDVFFCDRRTTVSTMDIQTNMYIQQKTDIQVKGKKNPKNPAEKVYELCYTRSGDGSCAAAITGSGVEITCCGADFTNKAECKGLAPAFFLVNGKKPTDSRVQMVPGVDTVRTPGVYKCGIDLTNVSVPVIDQKEVCLGAGRYTLFVTIEGKTRKVQSFTPAGELDVVYEDAESWYIDEESSKNDKKLGEYHLTGTEMGGKLVPVYVSNIGEGGDYGKKIVQPALAVGVSYSLAFDRLMRVYYKNAAGEFVKVNPGDPRIVGESGVDTLYATVQMDDMTQPIQEFSISVTNRPNAQNIKFYLPVISFVSAPDSTAKQVTGQKPEADGSYDENWVGSIYNLYLAVLQPDASGGYYLCKEDCNGLRVHKGSESSPRIDFIPEEVEFHDGYATISVRSLASYRWDTDPLSHNPATIVAEYNDYVKAVYSPMYFRAPPQPFPVLADVFDVRGTKPTKEFMIPEPYFSMSTEYLDGIGDSVAIYYDRPIHRDSLPNRICIMWDSASAVKHNPVAEGFSNIPKDTVVYCNEVVQMPSFNIDCSMQVEVNGIYGYCSNIVTIGNLKLSDDVKTSGIGKVISYHIFADKGKTVKQGFAGALTDRIAPIPLRAAIRSIRDGDELSDYDSLVVILSEPVKLVTTEYKKSALDFYLNESKLSENQRYASALGGYLVVTAAADPAIRADNGKGRVKYIYKRDVTTPHKGDYLRMGGNMSDIFWSDTANTNLLGNESLRSVADAAYYWNAPTGYNETKRLPSPWVEIEGVDLPPEDIDEEENGDKKNVDPEDRKYKDEWLDEDGKLIFAEPSFRIKMVGPFQFKIVMKDPVSERATKFAVMDLQGRVIRKGDIRTTETLVSAIPSGSYIVKVGLGNRRVNVR